MESVRWPEKSWSDQGEKHMRLVNCYIENFGILRDQSIEFHEGCNIICHENGWGKSTLAAFIKVMLYGFAEEKSRDELKNERKRYKPWQGGVYGGRLEFEAGGERYVLTRTFGIKEKEDRFSLRKKSTNLECRDFSDAVGEELFSLDCSSFSRTVFISQNDCETASTDAINAKLGNLTEDTDDINNYESVNQRFIDIINQMSPTRKTGSLYKVKDEISRLEENVRAGRSVDQAIEGIYARLHEKLMEQQTLKEEQAGLLEKQRKISAYKDIQVKQEKYNSLCQEYEERKNRADMERAYFPDRVPTQQELEDIIAGSAVLSAAKESIRIYSLTEEEISRGKQLEKFFAAGLPNQEMLKDKEEQAGELQKLKVLLAENQMSGEEAQRLEGYGRRFANGVPQVQDLERVIADWSSCVERKNVLSQKKLTYEALRGISQSGANAVKSHKDSGGTVSSAGIVLISIGVILILVGILLGTIGGQVPVGILTGLLGLLGLGTGAVIISRKGGNSRKNNAGMDQTEETSAASDSLDRMEAEILEDEAFIERAGQETKQFLDEYGIECEREGEILDSLYGFKAEVREYITLSRRSQEAQAAELQEKCQKMTENLQSFLVNFYPGEQLEEGEFIHKLSELRESAGEYGTLKKKGENFLRAQKAYKQLLGQMQEFMQSICITAKEDLPAQLLQIQIHLQSLDNSMREYKNSRERKEAFEAAENMEEILKAKPVQDMEGLRDVGGRLEEIAERLEKIYEYVTDYNRQLDSLREEGDRVAEDAENLKRMKSEYADELQKYELLKKTRELLEQAKISLTSRYTEPLRESLGKYYELISGESAQRVFVDANIDVTIDEQGMQRDPKFFSAGYRDLLGICMRMALVDAMYQGEKPFVIFDDPFANLDSDKLQGGLKLLEQIGREYQVLYFTCHESRV